MACREILLYPNPILKRVCAPVERFDDSVAKLARDLRDTLLSGPGVGIAAPQIGIPLRAVLVDARRSAKHSGQGEFLLLNPRVVAISGTQFFREGCLSVPQYTADIRRAQAITVEGLDERGEILRLDAEGYEAVVFQHEIDHLDGLLFIDRVGNVKRDLHRRKPRPVEPTEEARPARAAAGGSE
ncbi:MAG TPA: peptide deformylase [Armatimonadota bacterium]|jgi:peptide deformylase